MEQKLRLVVGISGASGGIYGIHALSVLRQCKIESHLVITRNSLVMLQQELNITRDNILRLADFVYFPQDIGASVASGSYPSLGMLIAPCSVKTMSEISSGVTASLISRVADVMLKEKRKLVVMIRETPLHVGHLRTMVNLAEYGAIIMPPVPAYYSHPKTIDDIVCCSVIRALSLFGIHVKNNIHFESIWLGIRSKNKVNI